MKLHTITKKKKLHCVGRNSCFVEELQLGTWKEVTLQGQRSPSTRYMNTKKSTMEKAVTVKKIVKTKPSEHHASAEGPSSSCISIVDEY
jgi:hypothetical protein